MATIPFKKPTDAFTLVNGVKIPCIGFGTWQSANGKEAYDAVRWALDCGYRHIDTAAVYGNEESVGQAIKDSHVDRKDLFVTTKLWNGQRDSYAHVLEALEDSLTRLQLDYVDLYLIHWPQTYEFRDQDWAKLNEEAWKGMETLYKEGKARAIGISNFREYHIDELAKTAIVLPMVNQLFVNPGDPDEDNRIYAERKGMLVEAYSPLGHAELLTNPTVLAIGAKHHKTAAQVLIRWALEQGCLPLPKSVHQERIQSNLDVFDFELDDKDAEDLAALAHAGLSQHRDPRFLTFYKRIDFLKK